MSLKHIHILLFILFISIFSYGNTITITGKVLNNKQQPLQYVSIGIINKTIGTVSDNYGNFDLEINKELLDRSDSLRFSMIGYKSKAFLIKNINEKQNLIITLTEKIETIHEAVITSKLLKEKQQGTSHYLFPLGVQLAISKIANQNLGSEVGRSFKIKHPNTIIKNLRFYIYVNNFDTVLFRINIYSIKRRKPYKNLLSDNIYTKVSDKKIGWISIDLKPYHIKVNNDIIVSVEWVAKSKKGNSLILPLARPSTATHYYKFGSQNKWERFKAMSSLMKLTLKY